MFKKYLKFKRERGLKVNIIGSGFIFSIYNKISKFLEILKKSDVSGKFYYI